MNAASHLCGWYGQLLKLYPARYRAVYTEERQAVFELAATEAAMSGRTGLFFFALRELADLPAAALIEHLRDRRWLMIASLRTLLAEKPDRWGNAVLAGLPHILFALVNFMPNLLRMDALNPSPSLVAWQNWMVRFPLTHWALNLTAPDSYWMAQRVFFQTWHWLFGLLVILMILAGWKDRWPRWSASWAGYGLIVLLTSLISMFPQDVESFVSILVWFALAVLVYIRMTRLSPLMGLMALLPFYPMFFWLLVADGIIGFIPETIGYLSAAAAMTLVVAIFARAGSFKLALILLAVIILVAGGAFAYMTVYLSNAPIPSTPTPGPVVASTLGGYLTLVLVGLPVWGALLWKAFKRRQL